MVVLEDRGFRVLRFGTADDWESLFAKCRSVFGEAPPGIEGLNL
jgi:hypothetical protein